MSSDYPEDRVYFGNAIRPSVTEVEAYARVIAAFEGCSIDECREQAELQLWASRPYRPRKVRLERLVHPTSSLITMPVTG